MAAFFDTHKATLDKAVETIHSRGYWSAYPEMPSGKIYGESAKDDGEATFKALLGKPFELDQPTTGGHVGHEVSPFGLDLGVTYPETTPDMAVAAARAAMDGWGKASAEARAGVCLEILHRINRLSFLFANAVMHTSGQAFMMAFQAGGPHAQDRGLEAVAYAYDEMSRIPGAVRWEKPQGPKDPLVLDKQFRIVPRGPALVIGCATFPTWNSYPGLFASLATGNPVIVKPHPGAILPLALTVKIGREVLAEAGFDPNVLQLAADTARQAADQGAGHPSGRRHHRFHRLAGLRRLGARERQGQAGLYRGSRRQLHRHHRTSSMRGMAGTSLAFSLSRYSGRCTARRTSSFRATASTRTRATRASTRWPAPSRPRD